MNQKSLFLKSESICAVLLAFSAALTFSAPRALAAPAGSSTVTIPIEEYLELRKQVEVGPLTVIDEVVWSGKFGQSLSVTVSGSSVGRPKSIDVLEKNDEFSLHGCSGNALVHLNGSNLSLLPQGGHFKLTCQVRVRSWSQINVVVLNALSVRAEVSGGEAILDSGTADRRALTLTRTSEGPVSEKAEIAAVARHRVTVLPEESRFEYSFQISNPSRVKREYSIPLANGELMQNVRTSLEYREADGALKLQLVPGDNQVVVSGRYTGNGFHPPIANAQNFLVVENHPMLQVSVESKGRRISVSDAGLPQQYPSSRAFLFAKGDQASWAAKKLEVFSSLGYSVNQANYLVYVPERGAPLVEAALQFNNQGTPEIPIEVPGRVTYLELSGVPQVLSKDDKGRLLLQVPSGKHDVLIQYEVPDKVGGIFTGFGNKLARPETVLSNVNVDLALAHRWNVIYGRSLFDGMTDVEFSGALWALLAGLITFAMLGQVSMSQSSRRAGALLAGLVVWLLPGGAPALALVALAMLVVRYRAELLARRPTTVKGWIGASVLGLLAFVVVVVLVSILKTQSLMTEQAFRVAESNMLQKADRYGGGAGSMPPPASAPYEGDVANLGEVSKGVANDSAGDYQGLPARIAIPVDVRHTHFSQGLVDDKTPTQIQALIVSRGLGAFLLGVIFVALAAYVYRERRSFLSYLRLSKP